MSAAMDPRPVPPGQHHQQQHPQPQQHPQRPRSKSTFSFGSDKSAGAAHSHAHSHSQSQSAKHDRTASWEDKLHPTTKADPNAAMEEQQPIAAALEKPTLQSLRSFQHTDLDGNLIAEPDLSNPTRSRWERPLDTIRSFEAAIDNQYKRRSHTVRGDSGTEAMSTYGSRRSSYYGGGHDQNRYSQASGYNFSRQGARDSYADPGYGTGGPVGGPPRTRNNRMQSDPAWNRYSTGNGNGNGVYPSHAYQQSRDTVHTNGSAGSHSEQYPSDPSSENSSVERARVDHTGEQYGFQGFGGGPILEEYQQAQGAGPEGNGYFGPGQPPRGGVHGYDGAPPPPPVPVKAKTTPIQLGQPGGGAAGGGENRPQVLQRQSTDKRRSWFKRRFSKE